MAEFAGVFISEPALVASCREADLPPVGVEVGVVRMESGARIMRWPGGQADLREGVGQSVVHGVVARVSPVRTGEPGTAWIVYLAR